MPKRPEVEKARAHNAAVLKEHGPRITGSYIVFIEARNRKDKQVKLGGLGIFGTGTMWVAEQSKHRTYPGYKDAPDGAVEMFDVVQQIKKEPRKNPFNKSMVGRQRHKERP